MLILLVDISINVKCLAWHAEKVKLCNHTWNRSAGFDILPVMTLLKNYFTRELVNISLSAINLSMTTILGHLWTFSWDGFRVFYRGWLSGSCVSGIPFHIGPERRGLAAFPLPPVANRAHPHHRWHLHTKPREYGFSKHTDTGMLNIQAARPHCTICHSD